MVLRYRLLLPHLLPLIAHAFLSSSKDVFDLSHYLPRSLPLDTVSTPLISTVHDPHRIQVRNQVDIQFELPLTDPTSAESFLNDSSRLVDALWDKGKYEQIESNRYRLLCKIMNFPVFGTFHPILELEVSGENMEKKFKSTRLSLHREEKGVVSNKNFLEGFDVRFEGAMHINSKHDHGASSVVKGFVEYHIDGKKPR